MLWPGLFGRAGRGKTGRVIDAARWAKTPTILLALLLAPGCQRTEYCADTCPLAADDSCDDGRVGATTGLCAYGTDCTDCGAYAPAAGDSPFTITSTSRPVSGRRSQGQSCTYPFPGCTEWQCGMDGRTLYHGMERDPYMACVGASCGAVSWAECPVIEHDRSLRWECRMGVRGVGCYFAGDPSHATDGTVTYCYEAGECDDGTPIERCVRMPTFSQPSSDPSNVFNRAICETWIEIDDWRKDCGSCNNACNLSIEEAEQACVEDEVPPDAGPGPGPDPACRDTIDEQIARLRRTFSGNPCLDSCTGDFADCLERSNCTQFTSCSESVQLCVSLCGVPGA